MSLRPARSALAKLRAVSPYVLVESLLPGVTLVALLLWLTQTFVRHGFGSVRQHMFAQKRGRPVVSAKPRPGRHELCLCGVLAVQQYCGSAQRCTARLSCGASAR